jgi:hypothetical protein
MVISPVYVAWESFGRLSRTLIKFGMEVSWRKMRSMGGSPAEFLRVVSTTDPVLGPRPINPWPAGDSVEAVTATRK